MLELNEKSRKIDKVELISVHRGNKRSLIMVMKNGVLEAKWVSDVRLLKL